ncbi:MAG: putative porin [Flavobacteriales bacterium]|nr:putative porin [Flavobacteriales bacterium]
MHRLIGFLPVLWITLLMIHGFSALGQKQEALTARHDSLRALRDTLSIFTWREEDYHTTGYWQRIKRDSSEGFLHHLFTALPYLNYPAEDNAGRAPQPLWYTPDSVTGFCWGFQWPFYFVQSPEKMMYYSSRRPYTQLIYQLGTSGPPKNNRRGDQRLYVLHTQPLGRRAQWHVDFFRLGSTGFYQRQWAGVSRLTASGYQRSANGRWFMRAGLLWHRFRQEENGGLSPQVQLRDKGLWTLSPAGDSTFVPLPRRDTWPVRLSGAEMLSNRWDAFLHQDILLGARLTDSLQKRTMTRWALITGLGYSDDRRSFSDKTGAADSFFKHYYGSGGPSLWVAHFREASAEAGFRLAPLSGRMRFSTVSASVRYGWMHLGQDTLRPVRPWASYHNLTLLGSLNLEFSPQLHFTSRLQTHLMGYNAGAFLLHPQLTWKNQKAQDSLRSMFLVLVAGGCLQNLTPAFLQREVNSNNFAWNLDLKNQTRISVYFTSRLPRQKLQASVYWHTLRQAFFYDTEAFPRNFESPLTVLQARVQGDFLFFSKHFGIPINVHFQKASHSVIRVPWLAGSAGFLFWTFLFQRKLYFQVGTDVYWHSRYEPMAWMPGLQVWYLQNGFQAGNYPVWNAHMSLALKRFRVALLGQHLNRGFPKADYWLSPGYPLLDRAVRLSLQWGLLN